MKHITIVSGKGGVGKTSISAALARLLAPLAIADADVDAADLHLVIPHDVISRERQLGAKVARLVDDCWGCTACVDACRFNAITCAPKAVIDETSCEGCGACALVCGAEAIAMEQREHGSIVEAQSAHGPFLYARLDPGAENSGRLVTEVRERAAAAGEAAGRELLLIDGPPGVGCPAIAALRGGDLALLICEPSISSRHDVLRLLQLVEHFHMPALAVINKADIDSVQCALLRAELAERNVPIAAELPFTPAVTEAQIRGIDVYELADNDFRRGLEVTAEQITSTLTASPQPGIP